MSEIKIINGIPELPKDSFISEVFEYARKKLHTPDKIIFWSLMALCGASIRDRIYFDFAGKMIFSNLPLLIIAPSGVGKTSSITLLERIFHGELPYKIPENCTSESFFKNFAMKGTKSETSTSCLWVLPEMADVFGKKDYQSGIAPKITRLLDNPINSTVSRMKDDDLIIENIALLNWICGSTYRWLIDYCEIGTSTGGFLPRLAIVHCEDDPRFTQRPTSDKNYEYYLHDKLKKALLAMPLGSLEFTDEIEAVRYSFHEDLLKCKDDDTRNFIARQWETFAKIYMVFTVFLKNFHSSSAIVTLSKKCSKLLLDNSLSLYRTIKMRNIIPTSPKVLKSLNSKLRKNIGTPLNYVETMRSTRMKTAELFNILSFYHEHGVVSWDKNKGLHSWYKPLRDADGFMEGYFNGTPESEEEVSYEGKESIEVNEGGVS